MSELQGGMPESDGNPIAESDKFFFASRDLFFWRADNFWEEIENFKDKC